MYEARRSRQQQEEEEEKFNPNHNTTHNTITAIHRSHLLVAGLGWLLVVELSRAELVY